METAPCPISGSSEFSHYLNLPDRFDLAGGEPWRVVISKTSGLMMLNPRPESSEIARYYQSGAYDPYLHGGNKTTPRERAYLAARTVLLRYRARLILQDATKTMQQLTLLEIGCSTGDLLNYFHRKKGIPIQNLAGVEPDREAASYGRERFGLNISPSLKDATVGEKLFDRIVLWHTLEHIHAIHETLAWAAKKLAPDGLLVIALPNPESADAEHYRENWIAWDAPRHLYHFVPATLEQLLEQHKLKVFKQRPYLPDTLYNTLHSEALLCKREMRSFTPLRIINAIGQATKGVIFGALWPRKASSLVYFVKKR